MNVDMVIVAAFIGLLNVAVITAVLGQDTMVTSGGVTAVTVGGVKGSLGFPEFGLFSVSSHPPAVTTANSKAGIHTWYALYLRIR